LEIKKTNITKAIDEECGSELIIVMPATGFAQTAAMSKLSWTPSV
jgi:hypothetical protein